ncbi:MAG: hypothetical protein JO027_19225 [Solirubrobacterales bacterium]|nr:hypothetical protein [Solirubrobacterales bacterium]
MKSSPWYQAARNPYLRWWWIIGAWVVAWVVALLIVAVLNSLFSAHDLVLAVIVGLNGAAATSPVLAWIIGLGTSFQEWADDFLSSACGLDEGLDWKRFWAVTVGAPACAALASLPFAHTFDVLSSVASVDAVLIVAVIVDRDAFSLVGSGGGRQLQTTLRIALLVMIALGMLMIVWGVVLSKTNPPRHVRFDLALAVSLGYGLVTTTACVILLTINMAARLLGSVRASGGDVDVHRQSDPGNG